MTPEQYVAAVERLGMTIAGAAPFLDINESTSYRYADGRQPVPAAIAMLLTIMTKERIAPARARQLAGLAVADYGRRSAAGRPRRVRAG